MGLESHPKCVQLQVSRLLTLGLSLLATTLHGCGRQDVGAAVAGDLVESFYGLRDGTEPRVLDIKADGVFYRVTMHRAGESPRLDTVFVTRDGKYLADHPTPIAEEQARLRYDKRFADCLLNAGVRIYVQGNASFSQQAVAQAGSFGSALAIDCTISPDNCHKLGVRDLPTVAQGGELFSGIQSRTWLETRTGCK